MTSFAHDQGQTRRSGIGAVQHCGRRCVSAGADPDAGWSLSAATPVRLWEVIMTLTSFLKAAAVPTILAIGGGLIDLRVQVGRLQVESADVKARTERIERLIDSSTRYGMLEADP